MVRYYTGIGSRSTPKSVLKKIERIAREKREAGYILRSGGAMGADTAFENGAGDMKVIFLPWPNFNGNKSPLCIPTPEAFAMALRYHPDKLALMRIKTNWQLHARNCHQVLGENLDTPSEEVICWTPRGEVIGGTATALRIASHYGIKITNLGDRK